MTIDATTFLSQCETVTKTIDKTYRRQLGSPTPSSYAFTPVKIKIIIETPEKQHHVNLDATCSLQGVHTTAQAILGKAVRQIRHKIRFIKPNPHPLSKLYAPVPPPPKGHELFDYGFSISSKVVEHNTHSETFETCGWSFLALVTLVIYGYNTWPNW